MSNSVSTKPNSLGNEPVNKLLMKFVIPSSISLLVNALYNIVDQIFINQGVGYLGTAATNVAMPIAIIALAVSLLIGDGAAAHLSLRLGQGKNDEAAKGVGNAFFLLTIIGIIFCMLTLLFRVPIINIFGATEETYKYVMDYFVILVIGTPFCMLANAFISVIRADGSPKLAMIAMIAGAVINTILDPLFIFVFGWEVKGAAIATILGQFASFLVGLYGLNKFKNIKLTLNEFKINITITKNIFKLGMSSFLTQLAVTFVMIVMNNSLKIYGKGTVYGSNIPLSAMGIVMKVYQITNSLLLGVALGAQPIIGFNYGAGNYKRVKETYFSSVKLALIISSVSSIFYIFFPQYIILVLGNSTDLYVDFAVKCFRVFLMLCIPIGFQTISSIFFQSIGKPIHSTILSLSRQVIFFLPAIIILPKLIGLEGCIYSGPVADSLSFLLAVIFIYFEIKQLNKLSATEPIIKS